MCSGSCCRCSTALRHALQSEIEFELLLLCGDATVSDLFHNRKLFSFVGPDGESTLTSPGLGKITTTSGGNTQF